MYTRFKECLLKPSRITKYVFDNKTKTFIYFLIILFIHILPMLVSSLSNTNMPVAITDRLVNQFEISEQINYKLEEVDGNTVLLKTTDDNNYQYVNLGIIESTQMPLLLLFNSDDEFNIDNYLFTSDLLDKSVMILVMNKDKISFSMGVIQNKKTNDNVQELNTSSDPYWFSISYEKLGITSLDFSCASSNITTFKSELNNAYREFYKANFITIYIITIPAIIIFGIISLLVEILIVAIIFKLFYRRFNLNYGVFCKIVLCAYTPCVVFNLLSIFYSSMFMYFIGEILTFIYITIALKNIVITSMGIDIEKILNKQNNNQGDE